MVAPDVAEAHEQRLLESEEALARRTTQPDHAPSRRRHHRRPHPARRRGRRSAADLPRGVRRPATRSRSAATPASDPDTGRRSLTHRLGRAFCSMLEAIPSERLPRHGGSATSVVVTIDHETLRSQLGAAGLGSGDRISATEAMRLACNASILPLVLDGKGQPLHLGRARRLFTAGQRTAMAVRDRRLPRRWLHDPRRLVRGAPPQALDARRPHRRRGRHAALLVAPPPRARPGLPGRHCCPTVTSDSTGGR